MVVVCYLRLRQPSNLFAFLGILGEGKELLIRDPKQRPCNNFSRQGE